MNPKIDYSKYEYLSLERNDNILTLTLNRPEKFNAIHHEMHEELGCIFYDIARDDAVDVVILTGAGKAFCAGGDLKAMKENADKTGNIGTYMSKTTAKRIIFSILDLEKPIIAKVNGVCVGLGATLALFSDIIYAADDVNISDPHVLAGVVAGDGGAVIWPQLIGYARAKEYIMTGKPINAREAARIGLINHAIPAVQLDAEVQAMAQILANGPRDPMRWSKTAANIGLKQLAHSIMDASIAYETLTFHSPTHSEAINAFAERRPPKFRGLF